MQWCHTKEHIKSVWNKRDNPKKKKKGDLSCSVHHLAHSWSLYWLSYHTSIVDTFQVLMCSDFSYNTIITFQDTVLNELSSYDADSQTPYWPRFSSRRRRPYYWWPGSFTARQVFDVSYRIQFQNCSLWGDGVKFDKFENVIVAWEITSFHLTPDFMSSAYTCLQKYWLLFKFPIYEICSINWNVGNEV
jgi:hypothetical protein